MIQNSLLFTTKFNVVPTVPKFVLTDTTNYASEGILLTDVVGVFKIEGPSGIIYNNTNFAAPDIDANVSLVFNTVSLPLDTNGDILKGNYTITYTIRVTGSTQPGDYIKTKVSYFCYEAPKGKVEVTNSVRLAKVTSKDLTPYNIGAIVPTITRTHTLFYPSSLVLSPTVSSSDTIVLSYPSVYTGTYTGKISTLASYVFTDGLIVDYQITAVDETIVDNKTLCDIYCGIKNLTNEMLAAKSTGDFGKAGKIEEDLSLIGMFFQLYDAAIVCGKEDDASNWLNQIISLANITVGCGCTDDEPQLVIPEGGGSSGNTTVVAGDSAFGTSVSSNTVGSTTTYTVRLTQAYKDLILGALQSQDFSVAAFRAAGIPEEARGVEVLPLNSGGGSYIRTPGTSKKILVVTGNPNLLSSLSISTGGSPIDGDSFLVDYRATPSPNGNTITIFGITLNPSEIASGNCLIYTWYAASNTTWYSKLISNASGSAAQDGLAYWVNGSDYALNKTVLYGTNPSFIYTNIQSAGSGSNPPTGTTASNTWWKFVGNKSSLYDFSSNQIIDVTNGFPRIIPTLNPSAGSFEMLVIENQEIKRKALSSFILAGQKLTNGKILIGNTINVATENSLDIALLRSIPIGGVTGATFLKQNLVTSGTISLDSSLNTPTVVIEGTVTLIGNVDITASTLPTIPGDYFWIDYKASATLGGNTLTILGVNISASDALNGNFAIYGYLDTGLGWIGRKINYNVVLPSGTNNQTIRYNGSNQLQADTNVTQDGNGNLNATKNIKAGTSHSGAGDANLVSGIGNTTAGDANNVNGSSNTVPGDNNTVSGINNTNPGNNSSVVGSQNTNNGDNNIVGGTLNTINDSSAIVVGDSNTAAGIKAILGNSNSGAGAGKSIILGNNNTLNSQDGYMKGDWGILNNLASDVYSNSPGGLRAGKAQKIETIFYGTSTSATGLLLTDGSSSSFKFGTNENHIVEIFISAYQTAGSAGTAGDSAGIILKGMVKSVAGTYSVVGSPVTDGAFSDAAASTWAATIAATASGFSVTVTGQANKTIQWTARITTVNAG